MKDSLCLLMDFSRAMESYGKILRSRDTCPGLFLNYNSNFGRNKEREGIGRGGQDCHMLQGKLLGIRME